MAEDLSRDLVLRLTANAEQAKAEIAALKAQLKDLIATVGELRTAQSGVTGLGGDAAGLDAQAAATNNLAGAQTRVAETGVAAAESQSQLAGTIAPVTAGLIEETSALGGVSVVQTEAAVATETLAGATETLTGKALGAVGGLDAEGAATGRAAKAAEFFSEQLVRATAQFNLWAERVADGSASAGVALGAVRNEMQLLQEGIALAQAQGLPIPPGTIEAFEKLNVEIDKTIATSKAEQVVRRDNALALLEEAKARTVDEVAALNQNNATREGAVVTGRAAAAAEFFSEQLAQTTAQFNRWAEKVGDGSLMANVALRQVRNEMRLLQEGIELARAGNVPLPKGTIEAYDNLNVSIDKLIVTGAAEQAARLKNSLTLLEEVKARTAVEVATLNEANAKRQETLATGTSTGATLDFVAAQESLVATEAAVRAATLEVAQARATDTALTEAQVLAYKQLGLQLAAGIAENKALGISTKGATLTLTELRAQLAAASGQFDLFATSTAESRQAMMLLRREFGAAGIAMGIAGGGLSSLLLPLGFVAAAAMGLSSVLGALQKRGLDVKTLGELGAEAMDKFSIALGGTSGAVEKMVDAAAKAQDGLEGLDETTRSYADAASLLTASGVDAEKTFEAMSVAALTSNQAIEDMERGFSSTKEPIDAAREAADQFVKQLNLIRLVEPGIAQELTGRFVELAKSGKLASEEGEELLKTLTGLAAGAEVTAKSFNAFGEKADEARAAFVALETNATSLEARFKELKEAGFTDAQAFTVLKGEIEKVATGSKRFADIIATLPPVLRGTFQHITDLAGRFGGLDTAIEKNRAKLQESVNSFNAINAAIEVGTQRYGSHALAISAVLPAVEKLIAEIEKRRDVEGQLQVSDQAMLDSLERLRGGTGLLATETQKLITEQAKQAEQVDGIVDSLKKLFNEYDKGAAAIEKHRKVTVDSAREESDEVRKSTTQQMQDLSAALNSFQVSQEDFNAEYARLQNEQVDARRKAEAEEFAINQKARADVIELQKVTQEKYGEIDEKLRAHNVTLTEALTVQSRYNASRGVAAKAIDDEATALEKVRGILGGDLGIAAAMDRTQTSTQAAAISAGALTAQLIGMNGHLATTVGLLNQVEGAAIRAFSGVESGGHTSAGAGAAPEF